MGPTPSAKDLKCPMCGGAYCLPEAVFVPGQLAPGEHPSHPVDETITIDLCGLPMLAIVASPDAPLRETGYQVVLTVCSEDCASAVRLAALLDASDRGDELFLGPDGGVAGLTRYADDGMTDRRLERLALFEQAVLTGLPDVAKRLGIDRPLIGLGPESSIEDRRAAESLIRQTCAWCSRFLEDSPMVGIFVWLTDRAEPREPDTIISVALAGRLVPAIVPAAGSMADGTCDAVFAVCGDECAAALKTAIEAERGLSIVH